MGVDTILQCLPTFQTSSEVYSAEVYLFRVLYPVMAKCDQPIASQRATVCTCKRGGCSWVRKVCYVLQITLPRCVAAKGEAGPECEKFPKYYRSLCPSEWTSNEEGRPPHNYTAVV